MKKHLVHRSVVGLGAVVGLASVLSTPAYAAPNIGTSTVALPGSGLRMTVEVLDSHSFPAGATTPSAAIFNHSATVSERARVTFTGQATGGTMVAGYLVGCQLSLSNGLNLGVSPGIGLSTNAPGVVGPSANLNGNISMALVPGQVTTVTIINAPLGANTVSPYQVEHNATALNLSQCGGRASAVPFVSATLSSNSGTLETTAYGRQFDF